MQWKIWDLKTIVSLLCLKRGSHEFQILFKKKRVEKLFQEKLLRNKSWPRGKEITHWRFHCLFWSKSSWFCWNLSYRVNTRKKKSISRACTRALSTHWETFNMLLVQSSTQRALRCVLFAKYGKSIQNTFQKQVVKYGWTNFLLSD